MDYDYDYDYDYDRKHRLTERHSGWGLIRPFFD